MARRAASLATRCSLCLALLAATLTSGARSLLQQADGRTAGAAPAEAGRDVAVSPSGAVGTAGHRGTAEATAAAPVTGHAGAAGGGGGSSGKSSPGPAEHHATARRLNTAGQASQVFPGQDAPSSSASRSLNSAATQFCSKQSEQPLPFPPGRSVRPAHHVKRTSVSRLTSLAVAPMVRVHVAAASWRHAVGESLLYPSIKSQSAIQKCYLMPCVLQNVLFAKLCYGISSRLWRDGSA